MKPRRAQIWLAIVSFFGWLGLSAVFLYESLGQQPKVDPFKITKTIKGHDQAIFSVAVSPDGRMLATGSFDHTVKLWDALTGEPMRTFAGPQGHKHVVLDVSFSPDGRRLASSSMDKTIRIWDVPVDRPLREFAGQKETVTCVALSPDETKLAVGSEDATVTIWNRADGKQLFKLVGHSGPVRAIAFSANGQLLGSIGDDHTMRLWNVADGKAVAVVGAHAGPGTGLAFHPNNQAAYTVAHDGTAKFWKLPINAPRTLAKPHTDKVTALVLTPDGGKILSASADKTVRLSTFASGAEERVFAGPEDVITALATNGVLVAAAVADNTVFVWNLADGKLHGRLFAHPSPITGLAIDPKGTTMLSTSKDGTLKVWALPLTPNRSFAHTSEIYDAALSTDGKYLFTGTSEKKAYRWDRATGKPDKTFEGHSDKVTAVAVSPNGQLFASGSADNTIRLFNIADGKLIDVIGAHLGAVNSLQFSDAGNQLLSAGEGGALKLWSLPTTPAKVLAHAEGVTSAALSPDGGKLLTAAGVKEIKVQLWNLADRKPLTAFAGPTKPVTTIAFSSNGTKIAAGTNDNQVFVWNAADGKLLGHLHAHSDSVTGVAFDPKGAHLLTTSADGTLKQWLTPAAQTFTPLWKAETGAVLTHPDGVRAAVLTPDKSRMYTAGNDKIVRGWDLKTGKIDKQFAGHTDSVTSVAVSPDGSMVASASADNTIRLWNAADGKLIDVIGAHFAAVQSVQFSDDGKKLLSSSLDGSVKLWGLPTVPAKQFAHTEAVTCAALSPDGTKLVTGTGGKDIKAQLWNLADGKPIRTFVGYKTPISSIAFSADGKKVAAGTQGKMVYVWQTDDGKLLGQLQGHVGAVTGLAFDAKGSQLLTSSADGTFKQWSLPLQPNKVYTHPAGVQSAVLTAKGDRLYTAGQDKIIRATEVATGKIVGQYSGHAKEATAVAVSPDGASVASADADGIIRLWNAADGKMVDVLGAHSGVVSSLQFNSDGKQLLSSGVDGAVKLWGLPTKTEKVLKHEDAVTTAALSPDGKTLVTGSSDKSVRLWNLADGKVLKAFAGPEKAVTCVAFCADGKQVAAGTADNKVFIWNAADGKLLGQLHAHIDAVTDIAFDAKGTTLLTTSADATLKQWSLPLKEDKSFVHPGAVHASVLSPDKSVMYTAGADKIVRAWDLKTGKITQQFAGHVTPVTSVALNPAGDLLASAAENTIRLWNPKDGKLVNVIGAHQGVISSLQFSDDGKKLLSAGNDGNLKVWSIPVVDAKVLQHAADITCSALSPDGTKLLTGGADNIVRLSNLADGKILKSYPGPAKAIASVAFSSDGTLIVAGSADNSVRVYESASGKAIRTVAKLPAVPGAVALSPDKKKVAVGLANNTIRLYDTVAPKPTKDKEKEKNIYQELKGHTGAIADLAFILKGQRLVSTSADKTGRIWNPADGKTVATLAHGAAISNIAVSADGAKLGTGGADKNVKTWNAADGKLLATVATPSEVYGVGLSTDGSRIVAGGKDDAVRIYLADGKLIQFFTHKGPVSSAAFISGGKQVLSTGTDKTARIWTTNLAWQVAHTGPVRQAVFAAKSTQVVSCSDDKSVKLWNAADGKALQTFAGHTDAVLGVSVQPDGSRIASVGADKKAIIWNPADGKPIVTFETPTALQAVAFATEGGRLAVASSDKADNAIRIYDVKRQRLLQTVPGHIGAVYSLSFENDDRTILTSGFDKTARLLDIAGQQVLTGHKGKVTSVAVNPAGTQALTGGEDKLVKLWDLAKGVSVMSYEGASGVVNAVAFKWGDKAPTQVAAADAGAVYVWSIKDGKKPAFSVPHPKAATDLAFAADNTKLATASEDGRVRIWDMTTKRELQFFQHEGPVLAIDFHPNGKQLAAASADKTARLWSQSLLWQQVHSGAVRQAKYVTKDQVVTCSDDKTVKLWNVADGKEVKVFAGHVDAVLGVSVSGDGKQIASVGLDKKAMIWSPAADKPIAIFETPVALQSVAFSPDGTKLAVGSVDKADDLLRVYDVVHQLLLQSLPGHKGAVYDLSFHSDNRTLVTAGMDKTARLIDVSGRQALYAHKGGANSVAIHPSGTQALTAGTDNSAKLWDVAKGEVVMTYTGATTRVASAAFSREPKGPARVAAAAGDTVYVWSIKDGKKSAFVFKHQKSVTNLAFSADGKSIATASEDGRTRIWDLAKKRELEFFQHDDPVRTIAFHPKGTQFVSAGDDKTARLWTSNLLWQGLHDGGVHQAIFTTKSTQIVTCSDDKTVRLWNAADGKELKKLAGHEGAVLGVSVSGDGKRIASVGLDKKAFVWDPAQDKPIAQFATAVPLQCVALSPDGTKLAVGAGDKEGDAIRIFDAKHGHLLQVLPGHKGMVYDLSFHSDNRTLATAGIDKSARLLDVAGLQALAGHKGAVTALAVHPDGNQVVTGGADKSVKLWKLDKGISEQSFSGAGDAVTALALSREKEGPALVAAASADNAVHIWSIKDSKELSTLKHPKAVADLAFNGDSTRLVTGGADGRTRIWDLATKRELQFFQHEGPIQSVGFHSNGKQVVSASADKTARLWTSHLVWQNLHTGSVHQAVFATKSTQIVSCSDDKSVKLWNVADGKELKSFAGHADGVFGVSASADGTKIASAGNDKKGIVWNAADGKPIATFETAKPLRSVAFSPDGTKLAVGIFQAIKPVDPKKKEQKPPAAEPALVQVYDVVHKKLMQAIPGHIGTVHRLSFHTDNRTLATASADKTSQLVDVSGRKVLLAHKGAVHSVAIHPSLPQALTGGADNTVKLWDLAKDSVIRSFAGSAGAIASVAFSREANPTRVAAAGVDKTVRVWNVADAKELIKLTHPTPVLSVAFSADNSKIVTGAEDGRVRVWDVKLKRELQFFAHDGPVAAVAFHNDNATVVSGGDDKSIGINTLSITRLIPAHETAIHSIALTNNASHVLTAGEDKFVKMWNLSNGNLDKTFAGNAGPVRSVTVSPSNQLVATGGADQTVRIFNLADGKELKALKQPSAVSHVAFSPNNAVVISCCANGSVNSWKTLYEPGKPLVGDFGVLRQTHTHEKTALQAVIAKDNATIYSVSGDKTAKEWKLASLLPLKTLNGHTAMVDGAVFSPNGNLLASSSHDGTVRIWDLAKGAALRTINAYTKPASHVYCLDWSLDGKQIAAGSRAGSLRLFDAAKGNLVRELKAYDPDESSGGGHKQGVFSVKYAPDGKSLVSAGSDGQIIVWNPGDGAIVRQIVDDSIKEPRAHTDWVYQIGFSTDGKQLLSTGFIGWLRIWDYQSGNLLHSRKMPNGLYAGTMMPGAELRVVTGSQDGVVNVIELEKGKEKKK